MKKRSGREGMVEQRRGHKSWHFQISFYQWYSRGDQRSPTAINIPININLRLRLEGENREWPKRGDKKSEGVGAEKNLVCRGRISYWPQLGIGRSKNSWWTEFLQGGGVDHPPRGGIGAGVRILALFFCYFELANNLSDRSHVCENVCLVSIKFIRINNLCNFSEKVVSFSPHNIWRFFIDNNNLDWYRASDENVGKKSFESKRRTKVFADSSESFCSFATTRVC